MLPWDVIASAQREATSSGYRTNYRHTVLYTGVTSDLKSRIREHKSGRYPSSFTARYNVYKLVYFRVFNSMMQAINEEKRIKGGSRRKKLLLIEMLNPQWSDLSLTL